MISDRRLLAFLVEALEPDDAAEVRAALVDPAVAARAAQLTARLPLPPIPEELQFAAFRIPPPGLSGGQRPFLALYVPSDLSDGPIAPGGPFQIRVGEAAGEPWLVVLRQLDRWTVVFPEVPQDVVALSALAAHPEGGRQLDLIAGPEVGTQRWAVALVPKPLSWEAATADGWQGLRDGLTDGTISVVAVAIEVAAP